MLTGANCEIDDPWISNRFAQFSALKQCRPSRPILGVFCSSGKKGNYFLLSSSPREDIAFPIFVHPGVNLPISCDSLTLWRSARFNFCPTVNLFAYTSSRNSSNVSYFQLRPCHYEPRASNLIFRIVEHAFLSEKRMGLNAQDST